MNHSFDINIAAQVGVNAAVLFNNILFWCEHHKANDKHFHDGLYWTYNSVRAFTELFPYMTKKQISTSLQKLITEGLIVKGNYNKDAYDRTLWYAVTEKGYAITDLGNTIFLKGQMEVTEQENPNPEKGEPIPNIITNIKPSVINTDVKHTYGEYGHVRLTDKERDRLFNDKGEEQTLKAIKYLDEYIQMKGYKARDHNLALRKWVFDAVREQEQKNSHRHRNDIDWDDL